MAYVLSLTPQSPLKRSFSDNPHLSSCSTLRTESVSCTLQNITSHNLSVTSLTSLKSNRAAIRLYGTENTPPTLKARSLRNLIEENDDGGGSARPSQRIAQPTRGRMERPPIPSRYLQVPPSIYSHDGDQSESEHSSQETEPDGQDSSSIRPSTSGTNQDYYDCLDLYETINIPLPDGQCFTATENGMDDSPQTTPLTDDMSPAPFRRWMSTLRRRHAGRRKDCMLPSEKGSLGIIDKGTVVVSSVPPVDGSVAPDSGSLSPSLEFVTAMKSASITIASSSIALRSDLGTHTFRGTRSSRFSDARRSTDSYMASLGPVVDESARLRSLQRRQIIEELISSEESYIGDLRVLINDYFMLLASVPTLSSQTKASIHQNISQILQLHQDLLNELHHAVPQADISPKSNTDSHPVKRAKHIRFNSADVPGKAFEHNATHKLRHSLEIGRSSEGRDQSLAADTKTAGEVARIFNKYMKRFFAYEEYGAHWTTMSQDLHNMCKGIQGWHEYERGVEALSRVVSSENNREASSKKALSFSDLLIKPIQRVCKYPLLFDDLCRHTPVYDDPEAHAELEKALLRLQEAITEVNKAKDDPKRRKLIETTWYLQDRLAFPEQTLSRALIFRLLGHVVLCGVLHVAFQAHDRPRGQYMVCVLYKSCLVLATTNRSCTIYSVVASIPLANASLEESDNGRGLQCYTASYTWKLVFEHSHRLHEIILSACSSAEEYAWKDQLRERILCETHDLNEGRCTMQDLFSSLTLDIKSIGPVFGHADSLIRRMSVHRSATMGPKTPHTQVIIKNTQVHQKPQEPPRPSTPVVISRSQSHVSAPTNIPTLAPRRADRVRLEIALEEVWTKDILPYPGMGSRRTENSIRASANSVMRKLSMASIASNFSRRSPSFSSLSHTRSEETFGRARKFSQANFRSRSAMDRRPAPALVDFHTAPAAFLPADFELQDIRASNRRRRMGYRALAMERVGERSPATMNPRKTRKLSPHITSLPRIEHYQHASEPVWSETSNAGATMRAPEPSQGTENRKRDREPTVEPVKVPSVAPPKRTQKNRSKIFKFWI